MRRHELLKLKNRRAQARYRERTKVGRHARAVLISHLLPLSLNRNISRQSLALASHHNLVYAQLPPKLHISSPCSMQRLCPLPGATSAW